MDITELVKAYKAYVRADEQEKAFACLKHIYGMRPDTEYKFVKDWRDWMRKRVIAGEHPKEFMELIKKCYLLTAREHFEDFCIYTEWDKPIDKRFYLPRQKGLSRIVTELQRLADDELDILGISMPPGTGKALANDTPILTRNGWKNHGDLVVGDEVIGMDGEFKKVIRVLPKCQLDRMVEFTNGEKIQCHYRHEWLFYDRARSKCTLQETQVWEKRKFDNDTSGRGHRYTIQVPKTEYIKGESKRLAVAPYTLGAWLGDGHNRQPRISGDKNDYAIVEAIIADGYAVKHTYVHNTTGVVTYDFEGLRKGLRKLGMCCDTKRTEKHIPAEYLTATIKDRLDLLAGLLDTDGTRVDKKYRLTTADEQLKETFIELISTFGWRASVTECKPQISRSGIEGKKVFWVVQFTPDIYIPCRLSRKQMQTLGTQNKVAVKSITKCEPKEGNCITVEGGMYLAGKTMIPTHNTGLAVYFITWLAGRNPDDGILTGSHNSAFLRGLYEECVREMQADGDYLWSDVFPERKIAKTNSMDMKIDIDTPQRFSTLQFTSVGAGNAGKVRAIQLLYCDDLVEGIEEALSRERLDKKYQQYVVDLKQRKQGNCKELHIATRWSVHDVIGRLEEENHGNPRAKFLTMPALDAKDHSNFDYGGNLGFTTRFYVNLRQVYINSGEEASWRALYMNEPIEREGQLYDPESLRRYYELPMDAEGGTAQPDAKVAVCDTAEGKGDDTVMPVFYIYGNDHYMVDCVCTDALPEVASEEIAKMLVKYGVHQCQFESNSAGGMFADRVENLVREKAQKAGVRPTHITKKRTTTNKETKIQVNSAWVKENCLFLDRTKLDTKSNYNQFMYKMSAYSIKGKNKHDDVPDALAQYALYTENLDAGKVTVMRRIF